MRRKELHGIDRAAVEALLDDVQSRHQLTELELKLLLEPRPSALVVEVAKTESRVSSWRFGQLRLLARLEAPQQPEPARIGGLKEDRHEHTHLLWHLKKTSETASRLLAKHRLEHVV